MRLIAFDSSTKITGAAIFEGAKYIRSGVISGGRCEDPRVRQEEMIARIYDLLDAVQPDMVVFEDVRLMTNVKTTVLLAEILGALMGYCVRHKIKYDQLAPSEWRQVHKIQKGLAKRKELKALQVAKVKELYNKDVTDDEADAILLGSAFLHLMENKE